MLRRVYCINFLDAFIVGVTSVAVPLMMLHYGIDVAAIGLAFSLSPIARIIFRLAGGAATDSLGERAMYVATSACNFLQPIFYFLSPTAMGFAAGRAVDGARESLVSSVNRVSVLALAPGKEHFGLAGMMSGRFIYQALGSLAVGMLFAAGGFDFILFAIAALALFMVALSLRVKNTHPHGEKIRLSDFSLAGKQRTYFEAMGMMVVGAILYPVMLYLAMPLYFSQNGYSPSEVGLYFAAYFLILGGIMSFFSHKSAKTGAIAAAGAAIFTLSLLGMLFLPQYLPAMFLFMAFGDGCLALPWEEACYIAMKGSRKRATDLAVAMTPAGVAIFLSYAASGFAIEAFGFAPIFILSAISLIAFAAWGVRLSKMK